MSFTTEEKQEFFENNKDMILNRWNNKGGVMSEIIEEMLEETKAKFDNFIVLDNSNTDIYSYLQNRSNILFVKPVQAGKTADVLKVVEHLYKDHAIIFVSDKNTALAGQTNKRTSVLGYDVKDFREINDLMSAYNYIMKDSDLINTGKGKKKIAHFLMEINNIKILIQMLSILNVPVALFIDEGDKNRNVESIDDEVEDTDLELPPITKGLLVCKNLLHDKKNGSKTIYITATPQGIMCSEKDDDRLVIYKKPYNNYVGTGLEHPVDIELVNCMQDNHCKTSQRWTGKDRYSNSFYSGVIQGINRFIELKSKDETVKQIMLLSLENRNIAQARLAKICESLLEKDTENSIGIMIFNGINKDKENPLLSDRIQSMTQKKIIVIAGFMAARGVSFTDFTDINNKYELVIQVHAAKKIDPLNSSLQAMRIYGAARRTVTRPILFCNNITYQDNKYNFMECYRVCRDLAEGKKIIYQDNYNPNRPLTQKSNMRYMKQGWAHNVLLFESNNSEDHERITKL